MSQEDGLANKAVAEATRNFIVKLFTRGAGLPLMIAIGVHFCLHRETPEQRQHRETVESAEKIQNQVAEDAAKAKAIESCRADIDCWAKMGNSAVPMHWGDAMVNCKRAVEDSAKFTMRWTGGMLDQSFSRYMWADKENGIVRYIGDRAEFQNGFGAWMRVIYTCEYDPQSKLVIDATVRPRNP